MTTEKFFTIEKARENTYATIPEDCLERVSMSIESMSKKGDAHASVTYRELDNNDYTVRALISFLRYRGYEVENCYNEKLIIIRW